MDGTAGPTPMQRRLHSHQTTINLARDEAARLGLEAIRPRAVANLVGISMQAVHQAVENGKVDLAFRLGQPGRRPEVWLRINSVREYKAWNISESDLDDLREDCVTLGLDGVVWNLLGERAQ